MPAGNEAIAANPVTLTEWDTTVLQGVSLSERDRRLVGSLRSQGRLIVDELAAGLRIQSRAWVGVIGLDANEIRITPKLAGDALGVADMLAFTRGTEALHRSRGSQPIDTAKPANLLELLALLLSDACERVVRAGLFSDYREHEDELTAVRGRLLVDRQVLTHFGRADRVHCRFDELEHDNDDNRLLALALQLCARRVRREHLHRRLRYLAGLFAEVCTPEAIDLETAAESLTYDRQNAHYRDAHTIAWLVLDGFGVRDVLAANAPTQCFAFLLNMNSLFEEFVWRLIAHLFPEPAYSVEPQERNWSVLRNATTNVAYRSIRPDVVVRAGGSTGGGVAIDAKYKRYDTSDVSSGDLYQGLLYAQAYARPDSAAVPVGFLIYPTSRPEFHIERVRLRRPDQRAAADLVVVGLPVRLTLERIRVPEQSPGADLERVIRAALDGV